MQEAGRVPVWKVFFHQFQDLLVMILLGAAVISLLTDNGESAVVIFAVITLNAILGTIQHEKAEKSLKSLQSLSAPVAVVLRDGKRQEIPSRQVVPGDILCLEAGDLVVADGRILWETGLRVNESSLTGESGAVQKEEGSVFGTAALADRRCMVYSGSLVASGRGEAVVTATGMDTEIGRIALLMNDAKEKKTPLQVSLDQFGSRLAAGILVICLIVFFLSLYRQMPLLDSLMFAVALAVAAIPEALGSIVTIVQAMGTQKMAREQAIIKDLKAVESLGCVSVICTDKTGTLTQNRMKVKEIWTDGRLRPAEETGILSHQKEFLAACVLAGNAEMSDTVSGHIAGDATEAALLELAVFHGVKPEELRRKCPRLLENPFESERKMMSVICRLGEPFVSGSMVLFAKGGLELLLPLCDRILLHGVPRAFTEREKKRIHDLSLSCSRKGLRVLALACRPAEAEELGRSAKEQERGLIFLGFAAMMDPPRPETFQAVADARRAGIRPVMITGDHKTTAMAIAQQVGILRTEDLAVSGQELDAMDDEELADRLERIAVCARVSPEHKLRMVKAWQKKGCIVAMTGDGVNDAPALKEADIGIAMGKSGTEVSKEASDMILADDNFATIMRAVANGRNVYRNIRNAIQFLLSGNMAGILCVLYTTLLGLPMPFAPVHLLFINLLTDSLPAIAIGMEEPEEGLLDFPPRDPKTGILTLRFLRNVLVQGGIMAVCTIAAYRIGLWESAALASTMAFSTLTLARLFHGFNCRSRLPLFRLGLFTNLYTVMAFEVGLLFLAAVLFIPGLQRLFAAADLSIRQLGWVGLLAFAPTLAIQGIKMWVVRK